MSIAFAYVSALLIIPLMFKQQKSTNKLIVFCRENHNVFAWLLLLCVAIHIIFAFSPLQEYPFGLSALICLILLSAASIYKKRNKRFLNAHKLLATIFCISVLLHVVVE